MWKHLRCLPKNLRARLAALLAEPERGEISSDVIYTAVIAGGALLIAGYLVAQATGAVHGISFGT